MLYLLSGQDDFTLTQSLEAIKREIGDQTVLGGSITTLDGQQVTLEQLRPFCETAPFLAGKRLVIIKGLLERFEPKGRASRQQKTTATSRQNEYKALGSYIVKIPDSTVVVLIDGKIASTNPLFRELAAKAVVKSFPLVRGTKLSQWVQQQVKEAGSSISPQAVALLAKLVGSNLWIMTSEITKLTLFTSGRRIEEDDVKAIASNTQQDDVFKLVDAIVEFRVELAEQSLEQLLRRGEAPAYLLFMLWRQVQMIVRAKELGQQRKPRTEIQHRLGITQEFVLQKTLEQASRYSLPRLKGVYHHLLETDLSIKTGKYDGELALNILVAELCQRGSRSN